MSPIKAIASPKVLRGYSPAQRQTVVKSTFGFKPEESDAPRKASEFKIKKQNTSKDSPRKLALSNAAMSTGSDVASQLDDSPVERCGSPSVM